MLVLLLNPGHNKILFCGGIKGGRNNEGAQNGTTLYKKTSTKDLRLYSCQVGKKFLL